MTTLLLPQPSAIQLPSLDPPYTWEPITAAAVSEMSTKGRKRWNSHSCFEGRQAHFSDRREFAPGSLHSRPMPLPLMALEERTMGHWKARLAGRIDTITREDNGLITAEGSYADTEYGAHIEELVEQQMLRWVSVDTQPSRFERVVMGVDDDGDDMYLTRFLESDITGQTLCPFPAFARAVQVNEGMDLPSAAEAASAASGIPLSSPRPLSLVASGEPDLPPAELFTDPHFTHLTHVSVRDVPGTNWRHFSGHLADWTVPHIGMRGDIYAPHSPSNYAYYRSGALPVADGQVRTGVLSLGGGHCPTDVLDWRERIRHYDSTSTGIADLAAGEDNHGPWLSGVLRPETTYEQARVAHASDVSGDWAPMRGRTHELVAVLCVNVAGFPVAEPILAAANVIEFPTERFRAGYRRGEDGEPELTAIVAAGVLHNDPVGNSLRALRRDVSGRLAVLEEIVRLGGFDQEAMARAAGRIGS